MQAGRAGGQHAVDYQLGYLRIGEIYSTVGDFLGEDQTIVR